MALTLSHAKSPETTITHGQDALVREFITDATLVAGETVALDYSTAATTGEDQVREVIRGDASGATIGVALEATDGTAGATVRVLVGGYVEGVDASGAIAAGDSVLAAANGQVIVYTAAAVDAPLGVALDAAAGGVVTLYWFPTMI